MQDSMESHKCWGGSDNHSLVLSSCSPVNRDQPTLGLLCFRGTLPCQVLFATYTQVLLSRAASLPGRSQFLSLFQRCCRAVTTCRALVPPCFPGFMFRHTQLRWRSFQLFYHSWHLEPIIVHVWLSSCASCFLSCWWVAMSLAEHYWFRAFSTGWPPSWQKCFYPTLSVGFHHSEGQLHLGLQWPADWGR